jgi:hypothetical protein
MMQYCFGLKEGVYSLNVDFTIIEKIVSFYKSYGLKVGRCYNGKGYNYVCPVQRKALLIAYTDKKGEEVYDYTGVSFPTEKECIEQRKGEIRYEKWNDAYQKTWQQLRETTNWSRKEITNYLTSGILTNYINTKVKES